MIRYKKKEKYLMANQLSDALPVYEFKRAAERHEPGLTNVYIRTEQEIILYDEQGRPWKHDIPPIGSGGESRLANLYNGFSVVPIANCHLPEMTNINFRAA